MLVATMDPTGARHSPSRLLQRQVWCHPAEPSLAAVMECLPPAKTDPAIHRVRRRKKIPTRGGAVGIAGYDPKIDASKHQGGRILTSLNPLAVFANCLSKLTKASQPCAFTR